MANADPRGPLTAINQLIKENRVADYASPNRALGMAPVEFGAGVSRWLWTQPPAIALNAFGTLQGGYLTVFIDELFSTAIASVLEEGEWAMTAEFKINFLRALTPVQLEGSASVLRRSRTLAFLAAEVSATGGPLAVTASSTWVIARQ